MALIPLERLTASLDTGLPEDRRRVTDLERSLKRAERRVAEGYLGAVVRSADEGTRAWGVRTAGAVLGIRAVPIVTPLLFDKSVDVRSVAMGTLVRVRPDALKPHVDRLLNDLTTTNALQVLWIVVVLRVSSVVPRLRHFAASVPPSSPGHKLAIVATAYTEDGIPGVARYLHDPSYCGWASYLLARLGSEEGLNILRTASVDVDVCREPIAAAVEHLEPFIEAGNCGWHDVEGAPFGLMSTEPAPDRTDVLRRVAEAVRRADSERGHNR